MRNKAAWCLLAVFLLSYLPSEAQFITNLNRYRNHDRKDNKMKMQLHKRMYLGVYGQHFMSNPITMRFRDTTYPDVQSSIDKVNKGLIDTTVQTTAKLSKSITAYLGVSVPLAMLNEKSMLCLDIEGNLLMGELTYDTVSIPLIYKQEHLQENMPFMMMSLPISFNYKFGGDASLSKDNKTMLSAGAGIATSYTTITEIAQGYTADPIISAVPFVKAEVGFMLGVAIKIRGTAYMGNYNLIDYKAADLGNAAGILTKEYSGQLGYNLSVMIMPLSFNWDRKYIR